MDVIPLMEKSQTTDDSVTNERFVAIGQDERPFNQVAQDSPFAILEEQPVLIETFVCYQILMEIETSISICLLAQTGHSLRRLVVRVF
jgi:hypothetical protein